MLQVPEQEFNEKPNEPPKTELGIVVVLFFFGKEIVRNKLQRMYEGFQTKERFIFVSFVYAEMINMDLSSRVEDGTPIHLFNVYY